MEPIVESNFQAVLAGDRAAVERTVAEALEAGHAPEDLPKSGLIAAMTEVGVRFERQEFDVPEMIVAARALQSGLAILKPKLPEGALAPWAV